MRILDEHTDTSLSMIGLFLTRAEALEMIGALENLLEADALGHHHVNSADFQKEVTVALYDDNNWTQFNERVQRLIVDDA